MSLRGWNPCEGHKLPQIPGDKRQKPSRGEPRHRGHRLGNCSLAQFTSAVRQSVAIARSWKVNQSGGLLGRVDGGMGSIVEGSSRGWFVVIILTRSRRCKSSLSPAGHTSTLPPRGLLAARSSSQAEPSSQNRFTLAERSSGRGDLNDRLPQRWSGLLFGQTRTRQRDRGGSEPPALDDRLCGYAQPAIVMRSGVGRAMTISQMVGDLLLGHDDCLTKAMVLAPSGRSFKARPRRE